MTTNSKQSGGKGNRLIFTFFVWFLETKLKEDKYRFGNKTEFVMNTKLFYWFLC